MLKIDSPTSFRWNMKPLGSKWPLLDWIEILYLNARCSNEFELALKDFRSLNKDRDVFCQALQDSRGDSKSLHEKL